MDEIFFPAEWHPQSAVQLTWLHEATDWAPTMDEALPCFVNIARAVMRHEKALIVCADEQTVRAQLGTIDESRVIFREIRSNDTWARDHGGITVFCNGKPVVYDFVFNGWGMKFPACHDNLITRQLFDSHTFASDVERCDLTPFVLEGGSIETDGCGTLMTTERCIFAPNRNSHLDEVLMNTALMCFFGTKRIIWLENGCLEGDDTDGHVDMLARFCDERTIAYVSCDDTDDTHFHSLQALENELKSLKTFDRKPYRLVPLPMADAIIENGERLPASYANFLIINGAVLVPTYGSSKDATAQKTLAEVFPDREIIGIDCRALIRQHGSLHCLTMQYPEGVIT